jgi:molybdopterin-guanine dinucleotide biosynthesis protein A
VCTHASAIILAGGQSLRMGRPKATLPFGSSTVLQRIIDELRGSFDNFLVVAAPLQVEPFPIEHLLESVPGVRLMRDDAAYQGAAFALARALRTARHEFAFVCSCDLPLLRAEVACALCTMLGGYDAVIPEVGGKLQPLCAVYRRGAASLIGEQLNKGERRLTRIAATLNAYNPKDAELRQFDPDLHSFLNVNTPEDYARLLEMQQLKCN